MKSDRSQRGAVKFMELLVVMAIILIVIGIVLPSYQTFLGRTRTKTAIRNLITIKKSLDTMSNVCRGYPMRSNDIDVAEDINDLASMQRIIDLTECDGVGDPNAAGPIIFPKQNVCLGAGIGQEIMPGNPAGTGSKYSSSGLCVSTCEWDDKPCLKELGHGFTSVFASVAGEPCSPDYGMPAGSEYTGSFMPGWNYNLLYDGYPLTPTAGNLTVNPRDKPVAVICGMARGLNEPVKVVINTSGFYSAGGAVAPGMNPGAVPDGSGMYDIDGTVLPNSCPCGPWCEDTSTSPARQGCCAPCTDAAGGYHAGIGFKY
jgi:hypothetical protein